MARPPIGLLESLRPWHAAGITHLLPDGHDAAFADAPAAVAASAAAVSMTDASCADPSDATSGMPASIPDARDASEGDAAEQFDPDAYDVPYDDAASSGATFPTFPTFHDAQPVARQAGHFAPADHRSPSQGPANAAQVLSGGHHGRHPDGAADAAQPVQYGQARQVGQAGQGRHDPAASQPAAVAAALGAGNATGQAEGQAAAQAVPRPAPIPPEQWPAPWRELLAKTPATAPVVWTYWALGLDLSGCAEATRRDTLRRILGALQQPRGSNAFWPVALPDTRSDTQPATPPDGQTDSVAGAQEGSEPVPAPELFLAGVDRIAPRLVVVMGSKALRAFAPELRARPYQQLPWRGRLLIVLPDMDNLVTAPATVEAVIAYLRTALKPATF